MPAGEMIPLEKYLTTCSSPDHDYVDGYLEKRHSGRFDHSQLQTAVAAYFGSRQKQLGIIPLVSQRVQVAPTRFRIPDVCVVLGEPGEQILTHPPFLCIEVRAPQDRMSGVEQRIDDYLAMGVRYVWVLDPCTEHAYTSTAAEGLREVRGGVLATENPTLAMPLVEVFA